MDSEDGETAGVACVGAWRVVTGKRAPHHGESFFHDGDSHKGAMSCTFVPPQATSGTDGPGTSFDAGLS